ncbi:unnamed protein product [Rotaria sordida]|uniref:F-box domain-containing protein n=1 Tax=Rotaria sordida TaxID=392033 RepID=A0A814P5P9_9BILA|nr:unnamed protein product [Rotaria sordida]
MQLIKSFFEDLANEILYEIFEYLDLYHVYDVFFYLNQRFQTLLLNSTIPIKINIPTVFKSNVEGYYEKMIIRNKHRINIIRLSNPFIVDIIFSPTHVISKFSCLEILILDNIHTKNLHEIFLELMCLPNLHSMVLHPAEYVQSSIDIFSEIFLLSTLKYFKLTYQMRIYEDSLSSYSWQYGHSTIEHLTINTCFPDSLLIDLLVCFPNLRRLSINYLTHILMILNYAFLNHQKI